MRSRNIFFLILILSSSNFVTVNAWEIDNVSSVIQVIDGDSFKIKSDEVRLADVSAPEWDQTGGLEATAALKSLIEDKRVYLDTDQKSGRDKYGRLIAVVYIKHNSTHYRNVNYILWKIRKIVKLDDYSNNEFDPSTWTKYLKYADSSPTPPSPAPKPQPPKEYTLSINIQGQGCQKCYFENQPEILTKAIIRKRGSLADIYPEIAKDWHPTKNGDLQPSMVTPRSGKKVWWQCEKGHEWEQTVHDRTRPSPCPICYRERKNN
jgi:hypothetical protein